MPAEQALPGEPVRALEAAEELAERRRRLRAQSPGDDVVVIEARLEATQGKLTEPIGSSAPQPNSLVSIIGAKGCGS